MARDWRANRRFHLFKSVTRKFVMIDHSVSDDWQVWTDSLSEYILKLSTSGVLESETWFEDEDFTEEERSEVNAAIQTPQEHEKKTEQKEKLHS